jgi:hypothetical protein
MFNVRTNFIHSPFSARYEFVPPPEPEPTVNDDTLMAGGEEPEPCMEEKQDILQEREERKEKRKKKKQVYLPAHRLLRKLAKQQQLEESLTRVVKSLH